MWIPLELISPKFRELKRDMLKCKTKEEKKQIFEEMKKENWKYSWIVDEIKSFFEHKQHWKTLW